MICFRSLAVGALLAVATIGTSINPVLSAPLTVPTSLAIGAQYRLAFVTSGTTTAASTEISFYNSFVTSQANLVAELSALATTWTAIASTLTTAARDNTGTNITVPGNDGVPIFLLDGAKLADDNADLWDGSVDTALGIDQTGVALATDVWAGTRFDGTNIAFSVLGNISGGTFAFTARSDVTGTTWVQQAGSEDTSNLNSLYALSDVLTVQAVPEPGGIGLMMLGLIGLGWMRRKID
jgi:hypothetical protein